MEDSTQLDIALLDRVCSASLSTHREEREEAERLLPEFKDKPDDWLLSAVPAILQHSPSEQTKFFAVQCLEKLVKTRWASLPLAQRANLRVLVTTSIGASTARDERLVLRKLDHLLIEILKLEWPENWPDFIDSLLVACQADAAQCHNALYLLRSLSEELHTSGVWDSKLSTEKTSCLRTQLATEFCKLLPLLQSILSTVPQLSAQMDMKLALSAVEALASFLEWVDGTLLFSSGLVGALFPSSAMQALALVSTISAEVDDPRAVELGYTVLAVVEETIPPTGESCNPWRRTVDAEHAMSFASLLTCLVGDHFHLFHDETHARFLNLAHGYLLDLMLHEEQDVLVICIDYWSRYLAFDLAQQDHLLEASPADLTVLDRLSYTGQLPNADEGSEQLHVLLKLRQLSAPTMERLRQVLLTRFMSPMETHEFDEEGDGELVRDHLEGEESVLFEMLGNVWCAMSHISYIDAVSFVKRAFAELEHTDFSEARVNRLCWTLAALSPRLCELPTLDPSTHPFAPADEHVWLTEVIQYLVKHQGALGEPSKKVAVASNVIFLLGRFSAWLRVDRQMLETGMSLIFEVLGQVSQAPKDLLGTATDSLAIISYVCRAELCGRLHEDSPSLLERYLSDQLPVLRTALASLQPILASVYASLGAMIRALWTEPSLPTVLDTLFAEANAEFHSIVQQVTAAPQALMQRGHELYRLLRLNAAVCLSLKSFAATQFYEIFPHLSELYSAATAFVKQADTPAAARRVLRLVRKQILVVTTCYGIGLAVDSPSVDSMKAVAHFTDLLLPSLLSVAIKDLEESFDPSLVEVSLFSLINQTLNHLGVAIRPDILDGLMFEPVIRWQHRCMRTGALDDLSELRRASYFILGFGGSTRLIRIETVSLELQEYLVDLCVHGMQVLNRDVAKNALVLAYHLFMPRYDLSPEHAAASLQFLRARAPTILDAVWNVITDGQHGNCKASRSLFDAYVADRAYFTGYENQAPVIVKIWELIVSLQHEPEKCDYIFHKLNAVPRLSTEDEDEFAVILQDFLFDLAPFQGVSSAPSTAPKTNGRRLVAPSRSAGSSQSIQASTSARHGRSSSI